MRLFLLAILLSSIGLLGQSSLVYPKVFQFYQADTIWGRVVNDPYRWMENIHSEATNMWLQAEKKITDDYNQKTFSEMKEYLSKYSHIYFRPLIKQGKYYFSYMISDANKSASLYCQLYMHNDPFVLFDPNSIDKHNDISINNISLSANNKTLALVLSKNGSDWQTIRFLNMKKQKLLDDTINFVKYSSVYWYKQGVFYIKYNVKNEKESFVGKISGR